MPETTFDGGSAENNDASPSKANDPEVSKYWLDVIGKYDKDFQEYHTQVNKIWDKYTAKRTGSRKRRMELFWANIQLWQPSILARLPQPSVSRRFSDADPVARSACNILERCLQVSADEDGLMDKLVKVRDDYLVGGRGTSWCRYEAEFEPLLGPNDEPLDVNGQPLLSDDQEPGEKLASEKICWDYVHWRDFGHTPARYWEEVTAVWRRTYLSRTELKTRFGEEKAAKVSLDHKPETTSGGHETSEITHKATVFEIWDKVTKRVYFVAKSCPEPLEVAEPYLDLTSFWPCPRPIYATLGTDNLVPVPDYRMYQDQIEEIDELTARIGALTQQLKLVGFYPRGTDNDGTAQIEQALKPGVENRMIAVPAWAAFQQKGGVNAIVWLPVTEVVTTLQACVQMREELKKNMHEVTGISDLMRGDTEAEETAAAQGLKNEWGQTRIRDRQNAMARHVRDLMRIAGEIIADRFSPETLLAMSNTKLPTRQQIAEQQALKAQQMAQQAQQQAMQAMQAQQQAAAAQQQAAPPKGAPGAPGAPHAPGGDPLALLNNAPVIPPARPAPGFGPGPGPLQPGPRRAA